MDLRGLLETGIAISGLVGLKDADDTEADDLIFQGSIKDKKLAEYYHWTVIRFSTAMIEFENEKKKNLLQKLIRKKEQSESEKEITLKPALIITICYHEIVEEENDD